MNYLDTTNIPDNLGVCSSNDVSASLQEEKRAMVSSAFGEDKSGGHATRLTVDDLKYLFRI